MPKTQKESMMMVYDFNNEPNLFEENIDIWDELNNPSKSDIFFYPSIRNESKIRLLGPHYSASRIYIPDDLNLSSILSPEEFKLLLSGDSNIKSKILNSFIEKPRNSLTARSGNNNSKDHKIFSINKISDKTQWQSCILINGYVYESRKVQINTFTTTILDQIREIVNKNSISKNKRINGLLSHDIIIENTRSSQVIPSMAFASSRQLTQNRDTNRIPEMHINICNEATLLPKDAISCVVKNGLYDIPKVIKYANNLQIKKMSGYFYIIRDINFKAPEEFTKELMREEGEIRKTQDINEILGYDTDNLPLEAIEDQEDTRNPIMNMEIE